jgi:predicted MFS family arabinose efflux permease
MFLIPVATYACERYSWKVTCMAFAMLHVSMMVMIAIVASMKPPAIADKAGAVCREIDGKADDGRLALTKGGEPLPIKGAEVELELVAVGTDGIASTYVEVVGGDEGEKAGGGVAKVEEAVDEEEEDFVVIGSMQFWLYAVSLMLGMLTFTSIANSIIPHLILVGYTPPRAAALVSAMALSNLVSKLAVGYLADRCGGARVLMGSLLLQIVAIVVISASGGDHTGVVLGVLLYGAGYGSFIPLKSIVILQAVGARQFGRGCGMVEGLSMVPGIVGPVLLGVCVDRTGSYVPGFYAVCGAFAVAMVMLHMAQQPVRKAGVPK